ncbi:MAG: thiol peroxidase [Deltaproteobacteria bacterium]|nr:MAG: thiol peroxidase [Deltaproteobacteria bacterium]
MEKQSVTLNGRELELSGKPPEIGSAMPDFEALDNDLNPRRLSDYRGKIVVISSVPSLDTPVCDMQTRRFNKEASELGQDVVVLTLSMDLPFAQKRWCAAAGVDRVITLSDHRDADFGKKSGLLIPAIRLLARAVLVLDREGIVRYVQLVPEVSSEPEYEPVLTAVKEIAG